MKNCDWEFTEKVDGTNIRVHWDGHTVEFGGRTDKAQIPKPLLERLETLFGGYENEQIFEQKFADNYDYNYSSISEIHHKKEGKTIAI